MILSKYETHDGSKTLEFEKGIYLNYDDLYNYEWSYSNNGNTVFNFTHETREINVEASFYAVKGQDLETLRNEAFEIFEYDVLDDQDGKLWIGDYYLPCRIIATSNSEYTKDKSLKTELRIVCGEPFWIKITDLGILRPIEESDNSFGLNYPYNYSFNYGVDNTVKSIKNDSFAPVDFELVIHGYASDPSVTIGDYTYTVHCEVDNGHELHINSREKTILLYDEYGNTENYFRYRDREDYIFQQIESGENSISWSDPFSIGLTLIEKRSEPKWI